MTTSDQPPPITAWLTWIALGVVVILVAGIELGLLQYSDDLVGFFPEFAPVRPPLLALALAFGLCAEVLLVVTGVLVGYIHADRIFHPAALRLVDVLVLAVVVATLLVFATLFFIPGPPQLFLLVVAALPVGATVVLVLLVLRSLLRRAVSMRVELDEVV
jgi:hypothetical protein